MYRLKSFILYLYVCLNLASLLEVANTIVDEWQVALMAHDVAVVVVVSLGVDKRLSL